MNEFVIENPLKGSINYEPYEFQQDLIDRIINKNQNVALYAARQMGTTTTMMYIIRELCLNQPGYKAMVIGVNSGNSKHKKAIIQKNKDYIDSVTNFKIVFKNESQILFFPGNNFIGQRYSNYDVYYDNYEFIINYNRKWLDDFHNSLENPRFRLFTFTGTNKIIPENCEIVRWPYNLIPERDEKWLNEMKSMLSEKHFKQEYIVE